MTITLRSSKSTALTFTEMDGNFTDLDTRLDVVEANYIKTFNGLTATSNALTVTTANVTENTNLYFTNARARSAISITDVSGDGSLSYNSSTGVITYTGPSASEVRAHFTAGEGIDISSGVISGEDASSSNKGIASFSSDHFTVSSGAVTIKTDGIDDTHIDFGTGANQVSTADIPEQTNLYYTDGRVTTVINATSIAALNDVLSTTMNSPTDGHGLVYNSTSGKIELAELPGAAGGEANRGSNLGGANEIFAGKSGVALNFRTIDHGDNLTITQAANTLTINTVSSPEFGNLKLNSAANTIENIATNSNIVLKPNGTGSIDVDTSKIINVTDPVSAQDAATKAYVDAQLSATDLTISTAGDSGSGSVSTSQTLTVAGTSNEIETSASSQTITVGLPSAVTVTTSLTVPTAIIDEITILDNNITTNASNADLVLEPNGTGVVSVSSNIDMNNSKIVNVTDPTSAQDASTKNYVDTRGITFERVGGNSTTALLGGTVGFQGTANEITVGESSGVFTIGLPSSITVGSANIDEVTITGNNITTNATNADLVLIPNGTGAVRTAAIVEIAGEDSLNGEIRFEDSNSSNYVAIKAPDVVASNVTLTLPTNDGDSGQSLITDGNGVLSFSTTGAIITNDESTNAERLVYVGSVTSGALTAATQDSGFTYNPSTGTLTAATFNGALSGTAAIATTVTLVETNSTDATHFPIFADTATGSENPRTDTGFTYNPNSGTLTSTVFDGTATTAQYADVAENYLPDASYEPGTVVSIGGGAEVTQCGPDDFVAGVVSTDPAYLMNSKQEGGIPIALVGRVPVRVFGPVNKGERVFADLNGRACRSGDGQLVGIAIETNTDEGEKLVECLLKV